MAVVTESIAKAFLHLKAPELSGVCSYLKQVHQEAVDTLVRAGDVDVIRKQQGRAQLAEELLELVESSGELVTKLSRLPQKR